MTLLPIVDALFQPFNYFSGCGQIALVGRHTILDYAPCWEDALGLSVMGLDAGKILKRSVCNEEYLFALRAIAVSATAFSWNFA